MKGEARITDDQDQIAPFETPTEGYTMFNLSGGYNLLWGKTKHQLVMRGTNLGDETGRVHTSLIKDRVILPGRNISFSYKMQF